MVKLKVPSRDSKGRFKKAKRRRNPRRGRQAVDEAAVAQFVAGFKRAPESRRRSALKELRERVQARKSARDANVATMREAYRRLTRLI